MFKRNIKIILIIVLIIQLSVPFSFLIYQANIKKHLDEDAEYIKINIDSIWYDSTSEYINIDLNLDDIFYSDEYYENDYLIFLPSENNEYSSIKYSKTVKLSDKHYIHKDSLYKLDFLDYNYKIEYFNDRSEPELYDKIIELKNIVHGYSTGNLTEAYVILKIHKNHLKIEKIYIGEYTLDEFVTLYIDGKIDPSRFHKQDHYFNYQYTKSDYLKYIDKDKIFLYKDFLETIENDDGLYLTPENLPEVLDEIIN